MKDGGLAWILENPGFTNVEKQSLDHYDGTRHRRAHQKSRNGCLNCKNRRIKCDEAHPTCGNCIERRWTCSFQPAAKLPKEASSTLPGSPDLVPLADLSRDIVTSNEFELLIHFESTSGPWLGSTLCQSVLQQHGLRLAKQAPHLLHAIFAIAASHVSFLKPREKQWATTATRLYGVALKSYYVALVGDLDPKDADAVFASSLIHAMLAFSTTPQASANVPLAADSGPMWIRSMRGIHTVVDTLKGSIGWDQTIWREMITADEASQHPVPAEHDTPNSLFLENITSGIAKACDVDHGADSSVAYTKTLEHFAPLMRGDATHHRVNWYMRFIATLETPFVDLLEARDPRALLILSFWCGRVGGIDQWWLVRSANIEHSRICAHLGGLSDVRIQALLQPAVNIFPLPQCISADSLNA